MRWMIAAGVVVGLAGCEGLSGPTAGGGAGAAPEVTDRMEAPSDDAEASLDGPHSGGASADAPETVADVSTGTLGRTVASLGNAAEPGMWLKTPLVASQRAGRVYYPDTNRTIDVTLIPIEGPDTAGSRLSLAAMQALGAPLTGLPEVDVFAA